MVLYHLRQRYSALKRLHLMPRWKTLSRVGMLIATVAIGVLLAFIPRVVRSQPQLFVSNSTPAITVNSLASTSSLLPLPQPTALHIADSSSDRVTETERLGNLMLGMISDIADTEGGLTLTRLENLAGEIKCQQTNPDCGEL